MSHPLGYNGFLLPELNHSYLAIFCEGKAAAMVTVSVVLFGLPAVQVQEVRSRWSGVVDRLL